MTVRKMMIVLLATWLYSTGVMADLVQSPLLDEAKKRLLADVTYDGAYVGIDYPMGDVPANTGVCTDVVIRSYRGLDIDLQQLVHEDMLDHFNQYPNIWGLKRPDTNIDHRRVPNLQVFFERQGAAIDVSKSSANYQPGDVVSWMLPGNLPHLGIVSDNTVAGTARPLIIHNIGRGPEESDILFKFEITGHYRYRVQQ